MRHPQRGVHRGEDIKGRLLLAGDDYANTLALSTPDSDTVNDALPALTKANETYTAAVKTASADGNGKNTNGKDAESSKGSKSASGAKTGDDMDIAFYAGIMLATIIVGLGALGYRHRGDAQKQ